MADEAQLTAPLAAATLSWRGETFRADRRGVFTVPEEAVPELIRHGFSRVESKKPEGKSRERPLRAE